jgi:hypothetical protein
MTKRIMNLESLKRLLRRHRIIPLFLIWLVACSIGTYLRLYPLLEYVSPEAYDKGAVLAINNLRKKVDYLIDQRYPFLSTLEKKRLATTQFDKLVSEDSAKLRKAIYNTARQVEQTLPKTNKPPYLQASDSYYYYALTQKILETGKISQQIRGSKYFNDLMEAPLGYWEPLNLHPYVGFAIHKIITFFRPDTPLMYSVAWTPIVLVAISLIPFLAFCALQGFTLTVTFVASINMLMTFALFERTFFGWYDNDAYNLLFPLIILSLVFYGLKNRSRPRALFYSSMACSFLIPLYALFWQGWVFLESILLISAILVLLINHFVIKDKSCTKNLVIFFLVALGGAFAGIAVIFGYRQFFILFQEGWKALISFTKSSLSPWPDLYIAVGELLKPTPLSIIEATGGYPAFALSLYAIFAIFKKAHRGEDKNDLLPLSVSLIFLLVAGYLSFGAKRFIFLCQIPLILLFPFGLQTLLTTLPFWLSERFSFPYHKIIRRAIMIGLVALLIVLPIRNVHQSIPTFIRLIFNNVWENALLKIQSGTPQNSIVNTWWPPGHFIKAFARRRVTFDGASINLPQSYWLASVLMSPTEKEALGYLRMLNNCANQAVDYLTGQGFKLSASIDILKIITPLSREQARQHLSGLLSPQQAEALLRLTHATPPPSYLLIYNDLVEKNIQLTYVANWNFHKLEMIKDDPQKQRLVPRSKSSKYINFLWGISGGQTRYSGELLLLDQDRNQLIFQDNVIINLDDLTCKINSEKYGKGVPNSLFYLEGDRIVEKKYPKPDFSYSIILAKRNQEYLCVLSDHDLAQSLLFQLYYFQGKGLKYLRPFCAESDLTRRTEILVYEVDWQKFLIDLGDDAVQTK